MPVSTPIDTPSAPSPAACAAPAEAPPEALARFRRLLAEAVGSGQFVRLVLAGYHGTEPELERVTVRLVQLRGAPMLSFVHRHRTRDLTHNLAPEAGVAQAMALLDSGFRNAQLQTARHDVQLACSRKGRWTVRVGAAATAAGVPTAASATAAQPAASPPAALAHNREKHRHVDITRPFLAELGVTDAQGRLVPAMARKWKQINKFVEVFSHALAASPVAQSPDVHVVDFGSGKGYLTFAIHDHLQHTLGKVAQVTGVELRPDMVALCNGAIARLGLQGLRIEQGDVRSYTPPRLDVMIALHACDIATDHALHLGVRAGAAIVMCSPCCHKQVRPQLLSPSPLKPILQHGVHLGQEAEMLTDGLRALLLEACGYDTQVFEFISLEHTNKNKMILGVKRAAGVSAARRAELLAQIAEIKRFYGVREQCLESLLVADGRLAA